MLIEASDLAKAFGSVTAVDGVSLAVGKGEILGLLGVNGAGKSTLMRLIAGSLTPDRGTALITGCDVNRDRLNARRNLGYLPEAATGFARLTVCEFLTFSAEGRGLRGTAASSAIASVVDRLTLSSVTGTLMGTLSKGWRQRAWLAQALVHDPAVLILDEPTDGLDPTQKNQLRAFLRSIAPTKAIVMSTHILEEAEALCDRIVVVARGRIAVDAPRADLITSDGRLAEAFDRYAAHA